ncbi:hypothetical protein L208DRAFT_1184097, partial [Tricholoma matsutake]
PLFIALSAAARKAKKPLTSSELIWHLIEEASSMAIKDNINKSNAVMSAQQWGKGKGKGGKPKLRNEHHCTNPNCNMDGHTKDQCWEKGGGKEGQAPEWWKTNKGGKENKKGLTTINTVEKSDNETMNYVFTIYGSSHKDNESFVLAITSDFHSKAHAIYQMGGIIIDSGATGHFSPNKLKFINYYEISPEPIRAADGHTFNVLGRGDMK